MLEIGSIIDEKYKILNIIGRGGMSVVYLAINEKANKPWAIKEVRKKGEKNSGVLQHSFEVEIAMLRKLNHPGLPSIIDIIDQGDNFLIVMDYIEGNTLEKILRESGAQPQEKVVNWAIQLCDVLEYLHSRKPAIVYRDMKPSNIMLRSDGSVVLIDFGTAREFKETNVSDTTCLGTQGYAAPEQFGGMGQTDARTDIYSLGATMYHLLTGHNPSEPPYEMYPITHWNSNLSTGLEGIITKCTQRNPADRYQSVRDLRYALEHYHDLDTKMLKKYRRNVQIFLGMSLATIVAFSVSFATHFSALHVRSDEYTYYLETAGKATDKNESLSYYMDAIKIDSTREEAYQGLVDIFSEDGLFDDKEEEMLLQLTISVDKYLQQFQAQNPKGYADWCYDVGSAYWYYYEHEENRQSNAVSWFQSAMEYYETDEGKESEYKRAKMYVEIGNFYKKIVPAQISGSDAGMYGEYWNNLMELKRMNDENPDRDLITLRLYKEIVTRALEYAKYLQEDGITIEEIDTTFTSIQKDIGQMHASQNVMIEIEELTQLIHNSKEMIVSSYKGGWK